MMKIGIISLMISTVVCMTSAAPPADKMGTFHGCASVGHSVFNPLEIDNILYDECLTQCFGGNFGYESANVCHCGDANTFIILPEEGCGLSMCSDEYCGGIFRASNFPIPEFAPVSWAIDK